MALALVLAGCGGDEEATRAGDEDATTTNSLSKAEYVKKGNEACADVYSEITEKYEAFYEAEKRTEAELDNKAMEVVLPRLERLSGRLHALGAPKGQERQVGEIVTALDEAIEDATPRNIRGAHGEFVLEKPYKLMWAYGLDRCGLDG